MYSPLEMEVEINGLGPDYNTLPRGLYIGLPLLMFPLGVASRNFNEGRTIYEDEQLYSVHSDLAGSNVYLQRDL